MSSPDKKKAPCGHGAFGCCCCGCVNLVETRTDAGNDHGYACMVFYDHARRTGIIYVEHDQHGMCEGHVARDEKIEAPDEA